MKTINASLVLITLFLGCAASLGPPSRAGEEGAVTLRASHVGCGCTPAKLTLLQTQSQIATPSSDPPGTIDSAKTPELIPDEVAYRLLLLGVAEPVDATPAQLARERAKIAVAGLAEEDTVSFMNMAALFRKQRESTDAQAAAILKTTPLAYLNPQSVEGQKLVQLAKQRDQDLTNTVALLKGALSAEGVRRLDAHVQNMKLMIKMTPVPPMPGY